MKNTPESGATAGPEPYSDDRLDAELADGARQLAESAGSQGVRPPPPPLLPDSWQSGSVARFLTPQPPPEREFVFKDLIAKGIVGGLFGEGGTGKSMLNLHMLAAAAVGKKWGPFEPPEPIRVVYIGAEDDEAELHRRCYYVAESMDLLDSELLRENMVVATVRGVLQGPLLHLDDGNPCPSDEYWRLHNHLEQYPDFQVLVLDPLSRYYGLNENDNSHATAWIQAMETLSYDFGGLTALYDHHQPASFAQQKGDLADAKGRGATSFRDGCRWTGAIRFMPEADMERYHVVAGSRREHIEFITGKTNYTAHMSRSYYFRRGPHGVLTPVDLAGDRLRDMAELLAKLVVESSERLTIRDLTSQSKGKPIAEAMKEAFPGFVRNREMGRVIDFALGTGQLGSQARGLAVYLTERQVRP